ncbi:hypothetical protein [Microvirga vignae]|uniref:hypothetical protein n=1 Tax=Microvirga vignae TaxID=1225564 RepID=UPI001364B81F|nr:hypothetical protein [Microvirga vignae]
MVIESLMHRLGAAAHKEHWPLPEEKVILLRQAQLPIFFETCDLRLDSRELTLKPNNTPTRSRRQLPCLASH